LFELKTHILLCQRVGLTSRADVASVMGLSESAGRMLSKLCEALESRQ
jgi:hypothetical protein